MLTVETIGRIRREHFIKGKTIREIARDLRVSRNTVRKVLRSGETAFEYERNVQPRPKLGRWTVELDELLTSNAAKPTREQLTLIRIFEQLRERGYEGGYDAVRRYARRWAKQHGQATAAAYVPLSFAPGEAYQFDWSHEVVLLNGVTVIVKAAHVRLCHSRMLFVRVYPRETQEMVFDAHDRAFALFKGACRRGIYDNMKTAVETVFVGRAVFTIAASCRCAVITSSIPSPARRHRGGRRGRSRTRLGSSVSGSSRPVCGSKPTMR
jgi:transposase